MVSPPVLRAYHLNYLGANQLPIWEGNGFMKRSAVVLIAAFVLSHGAAFGLADDSVPGKPGKRGLDKAAAEASPNSAVRREKGQAPSNDKSPGINELRKSLLTAGPLRAIVTEIQAELDRCTAGVCSEVSGNAERLAVLLIEVDELLAAGELEEAEQRLLSVLVIVESAIEQISGALDDPRLSEGDKITLEVVLFLQQSLLTEGRKLLLLIDRVLSADVISPRELGKFVSDTQGNNGGGGEPGPAGLIIWVAPDVVCYFQNFPFFGWVPVLCVRVPQRIPFDDTTLEPLP